MKLQYVAMDEKIADVLTKPLARVSTVGRSLVFSRSRFPSKGRNESVSHSDMVRGLVPYIVISKC